MRLERRTYARHYGPTTGDRIRLGDTDLFIRVEHDATVYGDEATFGGGKVIRDGMGQSATATRAAGSPDLVITNVVIVDSSGIRKADVGIRDGRIFAIGKAGNPGVMDGVSPELLIGASTEVLASEGIPATRPHLREFVPSAAGVGRVWCQTLPYLTHSNVGVSRVSSCSSSNAV